MTVKLFYKKYDFVTLFKNLNIQRYGQHSKLKLLIIQFFYSEIIKK